MYLEAHTTSRGPEATQVGLAAVVEVKLPEEGGRFIFPYELSILLGLNGRR